MLRVVHDGAGQGVERYEVSQHPCVHYQPVKNMCPQIYGWFCQKNATGFQFPLFSFFSEPNPGADSKKSPHKLFFKFIFKAHLAPPPVHPQNVRFQNVRFQNVRFQNVWNVRFTKRQVCKTSGLQNVRFTKRQVYKTLGLQNVWLQKTSIYIFCTCGWWKSAGSVAAMFAGKVMAVFYSLFWMGFLPYITILSNNDTLFTLNRNANLAIPILFVS